MKMPSDTAMAVVNQFSWSSNAIREGKMISQKYVVAEAIDKAIEAETERLKSELSAACGYMRNASIDLSTGCTKATAIKTIEGGLKRFEATLK